MDKIYKAGTEFFHGTGEPFNKDEIRVGGYDQILWTVLDASAIAQTYIPVAGSTTFMSSKTLSQPSEDKFIQEYQKQLGINYDYSKIEFKDRRALSHMPPPIFKDAYDRYWQIRKEATNKGIAARELKEKIYAKNNPEQTKEMYQEYLRLEKEVEEAWALERQFDIDKVRNEYVNKKLQELGYKLDNISPDGNVSLKLKTGSGKILPADYRMPGRLFVLTAKRDMKFFDTTNDGESEGDLTNVDYHRHDWFRAAEKAGYDGIIINDFAQIESEGNFGHRAHGFFQNAIKDLDIQIVDNVVHPKDFGDNHYMKNDYHSQEYKDFKNQSFLKEQIIKKVFKQILK